MSSRDAMGDQSGKLEMTQTINVLWDVTGESTADLLNLITALNNNSYWIRRSFDMTPEKARLLYDYVFEQLRPEFLSIFPSYLNLAINPSGV